MSECPNCDKFADDHLKTAVKYSELADQYVALLDKLSVTRQALRQCDEMLRMSCSVECEGDQGKIAREALEKTK